MYHIFQLAKNPQISGNLNKTADVKLEEAFSISEVFKHSTLAKMFYIISGRIKNTSGALLEFSMRTAMHGTFCVSSAISVWNN